MLPDRRKQRSNLNGAPLAYSAHRGTDSAAAAQWPRYLCAPGKLPRVRGSSLKLIRSIDELTLNPLSSCLGRITAVLQTISRRRGFLLRLTLAQRNAEALQSCTHELDALVLDTTVRYVRSRKRYGISHDLQLAVSLEQYALLGQLIELTQRVAAQQAASTKSIVTAAPGKARGSRNLLAAGIFFLTP